MSDTRRAVLVSFLSSNGTTLVGFAGSLVISRLLSPSEIGLYSIAVAFMGFAQILRDFGASNYIVQCKDPSQEVLRSALGGMVFFAWTLASLLWISSGAIASFYGQEILGDLLQVLALNLLLAPVGAVTLALLRRDMRFGAVGIIDFTAALVQMSVTCISAWHGGGAMSLAWGSLAGVVATVLMTLRYRKSGQPWLPGISHLREVLGFGMYASTASMMGHLNISASDLLLGKLMGSEAVGLFSRAVGTARLLTTILLRGVSPIVGPLFARLRRGEGDVETTFLAAAGRLTVLTWPALAFMAVMANEIIVLLYGEQWVHSASLVPFLCASTAVGVPFVVVSQMLMGLGRPELSLRIEAVNLPIKIAFIALAAPWGLQAVAAAFIVVSTAGATYQLWVLRQHFRIGPRRLFRTLLESAGITASTALAFWIVRYTMVGYLPDALLIAIAGITGAMVWLAAVVMRGHPIRSDLLHILPARWKARLSPSQKGP